MLTGHSTAIAQGVAVGERAERQVMGVKNSRALNVGLRMTAGIRMSRRIPVRE